jgi:hypothetical protein
LILYFKNSAGLGLDGIFFDKLGFMGEEATWNLSFEKGSTPPKNFLRDRR